MSSMLAHPLDRSIVLHISGGEWSSSVQFVWRYDQIKAEFDLSLALRYNGVRKAVTGGGWSHDGFG